MKRKQRPPSLHATKICRILANAGFQRKTCSGSHQKWCKGKHTVIVPFDGTPQRGLLMNIIRQSGLTPEEFVSYL